MHSENSTHNALTRLSVGHDAHVGRMQMIGEGGHITVCVNVDMHATSHQNSLMNLCGSVAWLLKEQLSARYVNLDVTDSYIIAINPVIVWPGPL